jgi:hypothetical protein
LKPTGGKEKLVALPNRFEDEIEEAREHMRMLQAAISAGTVRGSAVIIVESDGVTSRWSGRCFEMLGAATRLAHKVATFIEDESI